LGRWTPRPNLEEEGALLHLSPGRDRVPRGWGFVLKLGKQYNKVYWLGSS
jgi:hypothetical protein